MNDVVPVNVFTPPSVCVSETDLSQRFDASSPHLPWDHPFYDIARHQIIEVAGQSSSVFLLLTFETTGNRSVTPAVTPSVSLSSGDDNFGRKVIVFNACRMPPQHQLDHHKLLM